MIVVATTLHDENQSNEPNLRDPAEPSPTTMSPDNAKLPIWEAASEIIDIEHSVPLDGESDIALGNTFSDAPVRANYQWQARTATIQYCRLRDVTLDASTMQLVRGRAAFRKRAS